MLTCWEAAVEIETGYTGRYPDGGWEFGLLSEVLFEWLLFSFSRAELQKHEHRHSIIYRPREGALPCNSDI